MIITSAVTVEEYCIYPYKNNRQDCIVAFDNFIAGMEIIICDINVKIAKKRLKSEQNINILRLWIL